MPGARLPVGGQGSVRAGNGAWIQASPGYADESSGSRPGRLLSVVATLDTTARTEPRPTKKSRPTKSPPCETFFHFF